MTRKPFIQKLVIRVWRVKKGHPFLAQRVDRLVDVGAVQRDVLDALAVVGVEVFLDLRLVVGGFVDRDADLAARAGHRLGFQARELALDVEVADLAEVEQALVELGPFRHAPAVHVVGEVVDVDEARARRGRRLAAPEGLEARQGLEVDVVDGVAVGVLGIAIDEVDERVADAFDRRDVELTGADVRLHAPGAALNQSFIRRRGVAHAERHRANARPVAPREVLRKGARLGVDDEVHVALLVERDVLVPVARDALEAEALEERAERLRIGRRVLDELEAVGLDRVVPRASRLLGHDASCFFNCMMPPLCHGFHWPTSSPA